ncbi:MAG: hypothetical protein OEN50_11730, partial [Deltaproteobacteria bacterium]|nr:hypothetical protein [Deltaproteobacteria bacterium]
MKSGALSPTSRALDSAAAPNSPAVAMLKIIATFANVLIMCTIASFFSLLIPILSEHETTRYRIDGNHHRM